MMTVLFLLICLLVIVSTVSGAAPLNKWTSVDSDDSGQYLLAVATDSVYYSTDFGKNWQKAMIGCEGFTKGSISGNGQYMLVGTTCLQTVHSHDFGQTWEAVGLPSQFTAYDVDVSANGQYQVAASYLGSLSGQVQISKDFGHTWTATSASVSTLGGVAMSRVGDHIYISPLVGSFLHSNDYGASFDRASIVTYQGGLLGCNANCDHIAYTNYYNLLVSNNNGTDFSRAMLPEGPISGVAFSANGDRVYATIAYQGIYASTDGGKVWKITNPGLDFWTSVSTDSTGQYVIASISGGRILLSTDYGQTWNE